jgi:hypothetical protein
MKLLYCLVNLALVIRSPIGGWRAMLPERLRHTNPDGVFCIAILLGTAAAVFGNGWQALMRMDGDSIKRPSLDRHSFNRMEKKISAYRK